MEFLIRSEISPANSSGLLLIECAEYPLKKDMCGHDGAGLLDPSSPLCSPAVPVWVRSPETHLNPKVLNSVQFS